MSRARRKLEQAASATRQLRLAIEQKFVETGLLELPKTLVLSVPRRRFGQREASHRHYDSAELVAGFADKQF